MATKSFSKPRTKQPRSMEADPAFEHARTAFGNPADDDDALSSRGGRAGASDAASDDPAASLTGTKEALAAGSSVTTADPAETGRPTEATGLPTSAGVATPRAPTTRQNPANKMTIYPADRERERLARIRFEHRIGESFVAEYALEQLFADHSNQEIVSALRARGLGLRRPRTT